jgi:hypothetical protein
MSVARRLKRAQGGRPQAALAQALKAVEQIQGLQGSLSSLGELEGLIRTSATLVQRLEEDYQSLADELEMQREVFLRVLTRVTSHEGLREMEELVRAEVLKERE